MRENWQIYKVSIAAIHNFRTHLKSVGAPVASKKKGRKPNADKLQVEIKKVQTAIIQNTQVTGNGNL